MTEKHAGLERARHPERPGAVARPDRAGETERRVVRDPDRVRLVLERDDRGDRAEDLLLRDPVVVRRLDDRARVPVPRPVRDVAAKRGSPSTNDATFSRWSAEISGPISVGSSAGSPTFTFAVAATNQLEKPVVGRLLDEDARASTAVLARVVEDRVRGGRGGSVEIRVREDDVGRLAAELERHALDRPGGALHDESPDLGRAGEADLRDVGMLDESLPDDRALPDEDVHDALGDPGLEAELGEPQRGERRQLCRLEHDGVPARERRPELPARDVEREVPGDDEPDDAERLAERRRYAAGDRDRVATMLVHGARVEVEDLRDHPDLAACAGDRLADVPRLDPRELLGVLLDERREPAQESRAIGGSDRAPGRKRRLRARDRRVRLLDARLLELGDRLLGRGVEDGQRHRSEATALNPPEAVDDPGEDRHEEQRQDPERLAEARERASGCGGRRR